MNNNDGRPPYVQEMQAFQQPQIWPNPYHYPSGGEDLGSSGWLDILNHLPTNGPIITSVMSRDASPIRSPAIQDSVPLEENGLNSYDKHQDVLDEREDMIIERSLVAEEKQQSYAAALKEKQMASGDIHYLNITFFFSVSHLRFLSYLLGPKLFRVYINCICTRNMLFHLHVACFSVSGKGMYSNRL